MIATGTEHVVAFEDLARAFLAFELGRQRRFGLIQGEPRLASIANGSLRLIIASMRSRKKLALHPRIPPEIA